MNIDLDTLRGFFRSAPFTVDLGVEPTAVSPGRVEVWSERDGERVLVTKASATKASAPKRG